MASEGTRPRTGSACHTFDISRLLKREICLSGDPERSFRPLPEWAIFLMNCGYIARSVQVEGARCVTVLLLPTHQYAAIFTALGIILGSLGSVRESLTWEQLLKLPEGTELYVRLQYKGKGRSVEGVVEEIGEGPWGQYRKIKLTSGPKAIRGAIEHIVESTFPRLAVSMTEHPRLRDEDTIIKAGTFLKQVSDQYQPNWLVSGENEGLMITPRTEWDRLTRMLQIKPAGASEATEVANLLLASDSHDQRFSRLAVAPPGRNVSSVEAPVAVLDGSRALLQWREVSARNLILLFDSKSFDEEVEGAVFDLASARKDQLLPNEYRALAEQCPAGITISAFAVPEG